MNVLVLRDPAIQSHDVMAKLYAQSLAAVGQPVTVREFGGGVPGDATVAIHVTVGPRFEPISNLTNIAIVHHEWSRYPAKWVESLDTFDEVWVTSDHTGEVLHASGLHGVAAFVPPALDVEPPDSKTTWEAHHPFRFIACGEAHFRKGFHLLLAAFAHAFPDVGEATLTIKTSPSCLWQAPRPDITFVTEQLAPAALSHMYRESDLFVSVSLGEGLGLPVAEAMLVGLPVATNSWGGHVSLVSRGGFFEIPHRVVDQLFCSSPAYYAPGQQCALSDPEDIARVLRSAVAASADERKERASHARGALVTRYGCAAALARISARVEAWSGA